MELTELINHPERLDRDTLYELRSMLALYPYFQTARLLMLQNLYLLHDPSFDEELRRAAIYITDRTVIFQLVEAAHYKIKVQQNTEQSKETATGKDNRTISLIDNFLESIPKEEEEESSSDGWSVDEMPASIFDDPDAKAGETAEAIPETDAGKKDESESTNEK